MATYVKLEAMKGDDDVVFQRGSSKKRCCFIVLTLLLIFACAVSVAFVVMFFLGISYETLLHPSSSGSQSNVCTSDACSDLAKRMKLAMNESVDPCSDFYNFACGNWVQQNEHNQGKTGYGVLELQALTVLNQLADLLDGDFTEGIQALVKMQVFFKSCLNTEAIESKGWEPIRNLYKELGGWSLVNIHQSGAPWNITNEKFVLEKVFGSPSFYEIEVTLDDDNSSKYILEIEQSGLTGDPSQYLNASISNCAEGLHFSAFHSNCGKEDDEMESLTLCGLIGELTDLVYYGLLGLAEETSSHELARASLDIIAFETQLADLWEIEYMTEDNSVVLSLHDLSQQFPNFNWSGVISQLFKTAGVEIDQDQSIVIANPTYLRNLSDLLKNTTHNTLKNYAKWQLFLLFLDVLPPSSDFVGQLLDFRERVLGKATPEQRIGCVQQVQSVLPLALGRVYADNILPPGTREVVRSFVSEVQSGLRQRMTSRDWLDNTTRHLSIEKLNAIYAMVGYPNQTSNNTYLNMQYDKYNFDEEEFIGNFIQYVRHTVLDSLSVLKQKVDRMQWLSAPTDINAYYFPPFNHIVILEGILHIPVFSEGWPIYVQYGGLGMVLGHELTHGFDNTGRLYDKCGNKREWWTNSSIAEFNEKTQCFVQQYSEYNMFGYHVNGNQTLGENIADNGGLKASFGAYRRAANQQSTVPGLKNLKYTNDQLFFIAFGQLWCSYSTPSSFRTAVTTDEHSPDMFRVIGSLVNNPDFANVFNCPVPSPMNPENKCLLW